MSPMISIRNWKIIIAITLLLVVAVVVFIASRNGDDDLKASDITVPAGWYVHSTDNGTLMLTRQQELPDIGQSEEFAYGEQIDIGVVKLDRPLDEWITWRIPDDDPLYTTKERETLSGYQALRVEHESLAAGKVLDYYIFVNNRVYIFSLYPLESYDASSKNTVRNTGNVKILEQIVKDFAAKI
jgi:hypothetical protein